MGGIMLIMLENARAYVKFKMPKGTELAPGATDVIVTYGSYSVGGVSEMSVAQAKFLTDQAVHHEPVDMFNRQGFSSNPNKIAELEEELTSKGFKKNKTGA